MRDVIVIGAGASGMMAAIMAARRGKRVLILERQHACGIKLKATGGGRCNLTNTLNSSEFMSRFGKSGRFMSEALKVLDHHKLITFFEQLGVKTHSPDGYRVFPVTHNAQSILDALVLELTNLNIEILCSQNVLKIETIQKRVAAVYSNGRCYPAKSVVVSTGGAGYQKLGGNCSGYDLLRSLKHTVTDLHPAMLALKVKERWVDKCRADTLGSVQIKIDLKKRKSIATGDLIFTKSGIRGPVVLDISREITPLLSKYQEIPILIKALKDIDRDALEHHLRLDPSSTILESLSKLLPKSLCSALLQEIELDSSKSYTQLSVKNRTKLSEIFCLIPLTIIGDGGFENAMVTRGGVKLKEIDPTTMQSRVVDGLYLCGEVVDLDGPCGGYNLQFAFASGALVGASL